MFPNSPLLKYLRSKSPGTRTAIALIAALLPTLGVGYAQFYMHIKDMGNDAVFAEQQKTETNKSSFFASIGQIFSEGKKGITASVDAIKNIDTSVLNSAPMSTVPLGEKENNQNEIIADPPVVQQDATITEPIKN